jgi:FKBP-type peptidyl-prolyl cis-trans isomerase FkpA
VKRILLPVLLFGALFSGCEKLDMCGWDDCSVVVPPAETQAIQTYLTNAGLTATPHCSGMFYNIETQGTGEYPDMCSNISVHYIGQLTNGNIFDRTTTEPALLNLGRTITGWKNVVDMLRVGGKMQIYVPPSLGYGPYEQKDAQGNVIIPANSILVFEVNLLAIE